MNQSEHLFRSLHAEGQLLLLPCVWDAASARLLSGVPGTRALGTTSAGMAAACGLADGQHMSSAHLLDSLHAITAASELPVSVDAEGGYADNPDGVYTLVSAVIEAGAVGINLEDWVPDRGLGKKSPLMATAVQAERIAAARAAARDARSSLFINARTDVWWRGWPEEPKDRFGQATDRLQAYLAAGADGVFAPGFPDLGQPTEMEAAISRLVSHLGGAPLNLLTRSALPALQRLRQLGVRRVSTGSSLYRLAMASAVRAYAELRDRGEMNAISAEAGLPYADLQGLFAHRISADFIPEERKR